MRKLVLSLFAILSINCMVFGQGSRISGTVVSEDGSPLAGVSVLVKDTFRGVTTNADGSFTIEVPDGGILQFSFIGMQSIEMAAQPNMRVVMSGTTEIEGVIVTAMGLSRERKTLGYAASVLSGEDIANSNAINPMQALQGKVAGLDVSSANGVGGTQNVVIRGFSSFGNQQPLYIVDGIPLYHADFQEVRKWR
ncbi:MAG: carboxypeptidase-like regulatory domain-containing protein [Alistipes sp.]|nr:carboxypeptidase-like regulatory domain-containing protein [Alistipes sp.]